MTYNIQRGGVGRDAHIAAVVAACAPDIVLLQEATRPDIVERIARATGMQQWGSHPRQSLGFMSRLPVQLAEWHRPRFSRHAFVDVVPAGTTTRLFGLHLSAVHSAWTERRRVFELRALIKSIERHQAGFHVLAGDFNTLAPGELLDVSKLPHRLRTLVWLSGGRIRWRTIQVVLDSDYVDAYQQTHNGEVRPTFPTWNPHIRLDYVFVPKPFADCLVTCEVVTIEGTEQASDHFPLVADLKIS